jgi:hypothetical protein
MTAFTRDELHAIAAAHATGAASSEEELALHAAMQNDPALQNEVALNRLAIEAMASAQAVTPSDLVRRRLLTQARAMKPLQLASMPETRAPRPVRNSVAMVAAAAALVAVIGLSAEIVRLRGQLAGATEFSIALQAQLNERDPALNRMLTAEKHLRVVNMVASDTAESPGIQVYWNRAEGMAVMHGFRLPMAPKGTRYQLWAVGDGPPRTLLAFDSNKSGHVIISDMPIPLDLKGILSFELTVEPGGASVTPTMPALMQVGVAGF